MTQPSAEQLTGIREGEVLDGKYRLERVLGVGGMGVVVAAQHLLLDTKVAIKFLLPGLLANAEAVSRFSREARNAVRITNEHVARVMDVGTSTGGAPYMVMEYLHGADLGAVLRQQGPLSIEDAVDFVLQAMEAVAEAHGLGIVHRDLKPANLFCIRGADGRPAIKVLDFGISKVTGGSLAQPSTGPLTQTATLIGSPFYMSPEQMDAAIAIDRRTDIWSLGIILFELLSGRVPFLGNTVPEVTFQIATRDPPPLREVRPEAPPAMEAIVFRCLEKDREKRFANVAELAVALKPLAPKRSRGCVDKIVGMTPTARALETMTLAEPSSLPMPQRETMSPVGRTTTGAGGRKAVRGAMAAASALALAGGVTAAVRPRAIGLSTDAGTMVEAGAEEADGDAKQRPALEAATPPLCPVDSARCEGARLQRCNAQGEWVEGESCPFLCVGGRCAGVCRPDATRCIGGAVHACNASGQWQSRGPCPAPSVCREGVCKSEPPPPPPSPHGDAGITAPPADCSPPFVLDDRGRKHFKPECYR